MKCLTEIISSSGNRSNLTSQELGGFPLLLGITFLHLIADGFKQTEPDLQNIRLIYSNGAEQLSTSSSSRVQRFFLTRRGLRVLQKTGPITSMYSLLSPI